MKGAMAFRVVRFWFLEATLVNGIPGDLAGRCLRQRPLSLTESLLVALSSRFLVLDLLTTCPELGGP
jgi:hypothetical protein